MVDSMTDGRSVVRALEAAGWGNREGHFGHERRPDAWAHYKKNQGEIPGPSQPSGAIPKEEAVLGRGGDGWAGHLLAGCARFPYRRIVGGSSETPEAR